MFKDRSTGDILVIMIAGTVCLSVLAAGATLAVLLIVNPQADVQYLTTAIRDTINTLIGVMAGYLAGRTDKLVDIKKRHDNGSTPTVDE